MTGKLCKSCGIVKPTTAFYKHQSTADRLRSFCKPCCSLDSMKYHRANPERYKAASLRYNQRNREKVNEVTKLWQRNNVEKVKETTRRYREKYPEKRRAQNAVNNAILAGKLTRKPCEICGSTNKIHGHHEDYSRLLDVVWLCPVHHRARHRELNQRQPQPLERTSA